MDLPFNRMSEGQLMRWLALQTNYISIEQGHSGWCSIGATLYNPIEDFIVWSVYKTRKDFGDALLSVCKEVAAYQ